MIIGLPQWLSGKEICLPMQETQVWSLVQEDPLEKEMETHSSIFAWRILWTEKPGGLQSVGLERVRFDWAQTHMPAHTHTFSKVSCGQKSDAKIITALSSGIPFKHPPLSFWHTRIIKLIYFLSLSWHSGTRYFRLILDLLFPSSEAVISPRNQLL